LPEKEFLLEVLRDTADKPTGDAGET